MSAANSLQTAPVPNHVGIIMDGNGRWAKQRNLPRTQGHKEGLKTAKKIIGAARDAGVKYITLYVFSTENWKRTQEEVGFLMNLIATHLRNEFEFYKKNEVKLLHIGDRNSLPPEVLREIDLAVQDCKDFSGITVALAINYGSRNEILRAVKKYQDTQIKNNDASQAVLTEQDFSEYLDTRGMPDIDLLIRTGGEKRLSNFLLWQAAYAELEFSPILWPDYTADNFLESIKDYQKRNRRFGGL